MPGLIRGVARTAVVAGTATAVSNRVSRRQAGRWAAQEQPAAYPPQGAAYQEPVQYQEPASYQQPTPPPAASMDDKIAQLKELAALKEAGVLTEAELEAQKEKILAS
jgi:hypothetical protein